LNLHNIASRAIAAINPLLEVTITPNTGYTTDAGGRQIPTYGTPYTLFAQVQQLTSGDLRKLDGLNIQGVQYAIYLNGEWNGVVRTAGKGGDLMCFRGQTWLVVAVLEQWPHQWSKLGVVLQNDGATNAA
jgi:hypothetical protein